MTISRYNVWDALYEYEKMVGWGWFTRDSRKKYKEKLLGALSSQKVVEIKPYNEVKHAIKAEIDDVSDLSLLLIKFLMEIKKGDTGSLGQSRLHRLLWEKGVYQAMSKDYVHKSEETTEERKKESDEWQRWQSPISYNSQDWMYKRGLKKINEQVTKVSQQDIGILYQFAVQVKAGTSLTYGGYFVGFFRSQRKEAALDEIIFELGKRLKALEFFKEETVETPANAQEILLHIIHNAMRVRGGSLHGTETSSGRAVVGLINKSQELKNLLCDNLSLQKNNYTYAELKEEVESKLGNSGDKCYLGLRS